jgi:hypothetical protein
VAPTIEQIMDGVEARLATIATLRVSDVVPDAANVTGNASAAVVGVPPIPSYHTTMGRARISVEPTVTVFTSAQFDRIGQKRLAGFANPTGGLSVVAAVEADKTLGGIVDDCIVVDFRPLGLEEYTAYGLYGGVFTLRVQATGA